MGKPLNNPARLGRAALKTAQDGCKPICERLSKGNKPHRGNGNGESRERVTQ